MILFRISGIKFQSYVCFEVVKQCFSANSINQVGYAKLPMKMSMTYKTSVTMIYTYVENNSML